MPTERGYVRSTSRSTLTLPENLGMLPAARGDELLRLVCDTAALRRPAPQFPINRSTNTTCRFFASMANSLPGGGVGIFRMKPTLIIS